MRALTLATVLGVACLCSAAQSVQAQSPERVRVRFTADDNLRLMVRLDSGLYELCQAPCEFEIPKNTYDLYLQRPHPPAVGSVGSVALRESVELHGASESKRGQRIGGAVWLALGSVAGAMLMGYGGAIANCGEDEFLCFRELGLAMAAGGAAVAGISIIGGAVMIGQSEKFWLRKATRPH